MSKKPTLRTVTRRFQVTLPRAYREQAGIEEGDTVEMVTKGNELIVRPIVLARNGIRKTLSERE